MRAFEKHWLVAINKIIKQHCIPNKGQYKAGWKAALKWIRNDCCPEAWDVDDIEFDITEELKKE